eukprot:scaffold14603_cov214-Alexandrium_tamarense.AAC.6
MEARRLNPYIRHRTCSTQTPSTLNEVDPESPRLHSKCTLDLRRKWIKGLQCGVRIMLQLVTESLLYGNSALFNLPLQIISITIKCVMSKVTPAH